MKLSEEEYLVILIVIGFFSLILQLLEFISNLVKKERIRTGYF